MNPEIHFKRKNVHRRVVIRLAEMVATMTTFVIIFSVLLTALNWPAYSMILQDMVTPEQTIYEDDQDQISFEQLQKLIEEEQVQQEVQHQIEKDQEEGKSLKSFDLEAMGELYPNEMRLEVPKVFEGTIPIRDVEVEHFDFKDLYESENKIQEALREGVVHYPYTADPDKYGNVFITGHSSYMPWDPGKYKDIFALLHKLEIGDQYAIYFKGKKYKYRVFDIFEIKPDDISVLSQPTDKKISTLMTCTPVGTTLRRLIVRANLIEVQ